MASYIQFVSKETNKAISLSLLDQEICTVLNTEIHEKRYGGGKTWDWFNTIAYFITTGLSLEGTSEGSVYHYYETSSTWTEEWPDIKKVIEYLQKNYIAKCSYGR